MDATVVMGQFVPFPSPQKLPTPMFSSVACGFPSPTEESVEQMTSLDELAVTAPAATFFVRAGGDSMTGAGIFSGDILVVDRSITPVHEDIVVAVVHGEFTCKRLLIRDRHITLHPENTEFADIHIAKEHGFFTWGVCTFNLHRLRALRPVKARRT